MGYPCYDHQLGCYLESYSDRVAAEKRLGLVALEKGEVVKKKQPEKIDIKRMIWESIKRLEQDPSILYKSKQEARKRKYEQMLIDYEKGLYTFKTA
jgi:hypothetical protein